MSLHSWEQQIFPETARWMLRAYKKQAYSLVPAVESKMLLCMGREGKNSMWIQAILFRMEDN